MYDSLQRLVAQVVVFSFLLPSCSIPIQSEYILPVTEASTSFPEPLATGSVSALVCTAAHRHRANPTQILWSQSGAVVSFYERHGVWKAKIHTDLRGVDEPLLPVLCAGHQSPSEVLAVLGKQEPVVHKHRVHQMLTAVGPSIFLGSLGLLGGMEGAEKEDISLTLHDAASSGNLAAVQQFLERDLNPNMRNMHDQTPLHFAVWKGNMAVVQALLEKGADPNLTDAFNYTALHIAAEKEHLAIVKLLLENGADPTIVDDVNNMALHVAADIGNLAIVKLLLDHTCNPAYINQAGKDGYTPLHWAIYKGLTEIVAALLQSGADPNIGDEAGNTSLHIALVVPEIGIELVKLLLNNHADPNQRNSNGLAPFHLAVATDDLAIVQLFLEKGANPNIVDHDNWPPLQVATWYGYESIVQALLQAGADMHIVDKYGNTLLHIAAENGCLAIIKLLLDHEASINMQNIHGNTFLHILASRQGVDLFLGAVEHVSIAHLACFSKLQAGLIDYASMKDMVSMLVDYVQGIDWNLRNNRGKTIRDLLEEQASFQNFKFAHALRMVAKQETLGGWYADNQPLGSPRRLLHEDRADLNAADSSSERVSKKARHHY